MQPLAGLALVVVLWQIGVTISQNTILPGPFPVFEGVVELASNGVLFKHIIASLFRVTWGYFGAVLVGIPAGLCLGWYRRSERAFNPLIQVFRPISPLAWIPIAILWFGVGDMAAVVLIFLASVLPLILSAMNAVHHIPAVHLNAGRNFGLSGTELVRRVIFPAVLPNLVVGLRLALGISWIVVVAAEMIAVNSGLGFLIIDSRNAGNRYDLVIAGMLMIGLIGVGLDAAMRRLENLKSVRWSYANLSAAEKGLRPVTRSAS